VEQGIKPSSAIEAIEDRVPNEDCVFKESDSSTASSLAAVPAAITDPLAGSEDASRFCPVCSQRLKSRRCKLICDVCGYYMSCADYY
jgi:hypothetical protein